MSTVIDLWYRFNEGNGPTANTFDTDLSNNSIIVGYGDSKKRGLWESQVPYSVLGTTKIYSLGLNLNESLWEKDREII